MSTVPSLYTARAVIRLGRLDDAASLLRYRQDNRLHLAPWEPRREEGYYSLEACQRSLLNGLLAARDEVGFPLLVMTPVQDAVMATVTLGNIVRGVFQAGHLGYGVAAAWQGRGLMFEVLQAVLRWAFDELSLHRVMANYLPHNERSARLLQLLGFEREGYARDYLQIGGIWRDHVLTAKIAPAAHPGRLDIG